MFSVVLLYNNSNNCTEKDILDFIVNEALPKGFMNIYNSIFFIAWLFLAFHQRAYYWLILQININNTISLRKEEEEDQT